MTDTRRTLTNHDQRPISDKRILLLFGMSAIVMSRSRGRDTTRPRLLLLLLLLVMLCSGVFIDVKRWSRFIYFLKTFIFQTIFLF